MLFVELPYSGLLVNWYERIRLIMALFMLMRNLHGTHNVIHVVEHKLLLSTNICFSSSKLGQVKLRGGSDYRMCASKAVVV